jgi:hypothetical protein
MRFVEFLYQQVVPLLLAHAGQRILPAVFAPLMRSPVPGVQPSTYARAETSLIDPRQNLPLRARRAGGGHKSAGLFVGEDRNVRLGFGEVREIAKEAHQSSCSGINPRQGEDVSSTSHLFEDVVEEFVCLHYERRNCKRRWAKHIEKCLGTQSCLAILLAKKGAMLTAHP